MATSDHGSTDARGSEQIPNVATLPWLGAAARILIEGGPFLLRCFARHGPVFRTRFLGGDLVHLMGREASEFVLDIECESFSHADGYAMVRKLFGDGLLFQDGPGHKRNRSLMVPAFTARAVEDLFDLMRDCAAAHVARWAETPAQSMYERFRLYTADVAIRAMLGVSSSAALDDLSRAFATLGRGAAALIRVRHGPTTYAAGIRARDHLRSRLATLLRAWPDHVPCDALGRLVSARDAAGDSLLEEDELIDQAITLIFAGHETTTSMLTSTLSALESAPEVRARVLEEQRRLAQSGPLSVEQLRSMPELDCLLREVERLWPPVYIAQRGLRRDVSFAGFELPAGTQVTYSAFVSHRDPAAFAHPERFDPERFAESCPTHRAAQSGLFGFGGGPRRCLGYAFAQQEMKVVLATLMRGHRLLGLNPAPRIGYVPTIHPRCGLPARVVSLATPPSRAAAGSSPRPRGAAT